MGPALLLVAAAVGSTIVVTAPPFAAPPIADTELARMRGGLRLPNGLDLALGIDIQTRVDGLLALHTVYASEGSDPGIRVYTDGANPVRSAPSMATVTAGPVSAAPILVVGRTPTGTTVIPAAAVAPSTVNLVHGDPSLWLNGEGQTEVPVTPNGPPVGAPPGAISLTTGDAGAIVTLAAPDLQIQQLVGRSTGVVVANSGSDRAIDTISAINVDLRGLPTAQLSAAFAAQRAVLESTLGR